MTRLWVIFKRTVDEAKTPLFSEGLSWSRMCRITCARLKILALLTALHVLLMLIVIAAAWAGR